jgi:4-hydroxy-tetrahydrodipicolinate reductase
LVTVTGILAAAEDREAGGPVRVVLAGASGRMGREVVSAFGSTADLALVGAVSRQFSGAEGRPASTLESDLAALGVRTYAALAPCLARERPDVLVEFTTASVAPDNLKAALEAGVVPVSGTTGLSTDELAAVDRLARSRGLGAAVVPNFSLGATVLSILARRAASYFEAAELVELHHDQKRDAPSGTALALARAVASGLRKSDQAGGDPAASLVAAGSDRTAGGAPPKTQATVTSSPPQASRGLSVDGVHVHSVRLSGLVAHHELVFASHGETLSLRHDSVSRSSFMPGLLMTVRQARKIEGLVTSLEEILVLAGLCLPGG